MHSGGAGEGCLKHIHGAPRVQQSPLLQLCTSMQVSTCAERPVGRLWVAFVAVKLNACACSGLFHQCMLLPRLYV